MQSILHFGAQNYLPDSKGFAETMFKKFIQIRLRVFAIWNL